MSDFWTPKQFAAMLGGKWLTEPVDMAAPLLGVSIDTRAIEPMQAFVAVKGDTFDGHDFVEQAAERGATFAIVERKPSAIRHPPSAIPLLLVRDTVKALQTLALLWRDELAAHGCKVIAVTGSSGKTTTRQLIAHVLSGRFTGTQSPKSFNNHLGVPLTLLAARSDHDFVVAEVGTNHPGEIADLAAILRPDCAVITTIGEAHIGHFGSRAAIAKEKRSLYDFVRGDGLKVEPDLPPEARLVARLPLPGDHMKRNAQAAAAVARWMGVSDAQIAERLATAPAAEGRQQVLRFGGVTVIHDAYNANPDSVRAAVEMLTATPADRRVLVFGDMLELGEHSAAAHRRIGALYREKRSQGDLLVTIGEQAKLAGGEHVLGPWTDDTPARVAALLDVGDLVLIKGSRGMKLERLLPAIEARFAEGVGLRG